MEENRKRYDDENGKEKGVAIKSGVGQRLARYLTGGVSPYHVVRLCAEDLRDRGFEELTMSGVWHLREGGRYYINHHGTTLLAFVLPKREKMLAEGETLTGKKVRMGERAPALRIACAHTDFPCLRVKPSPDLAGNGYHRLNTEVYGGAILNTWLDRPLGIAGRVIMASEDPFAPGERLYDSARPLLTVPNLAIHMNPEVNKGQALNRQTDLMPLFAAETGSCGEVHDGVAQAGGNLQSGGNSQNGENSQKDGDPQNSGKFSDFLRSELGEDPLEYDLTVYVAEDPTLLGRNREFLSAPRIDNISSVAAVMENLTEFSDEEPECLRVAAFFDHEEIGSRTKQGALSALLTDALEKLYESAGYTARQAKDAIYQGMMLSVDVAHALHPNHPEKADVTSQPVMTKGFCIKQAAAQSYATDAAAIAVVEQLAGKRGILCQRYANRSDMVGGSTLGSLSSALLPMRTVDIGIPVLAMHSARELMGLSDLEALSELIGAFYGCGKERR